MERIQARLTDHFFVTKIDGIYRVFPFTFRARVFLWFENKRNKRKVENFWQYRK